MSPQPMLFHPHVFFTAVILLSGSLTGCESPPDKSAVKTFIVEVTQHIEAQSEFGFSEAEIYLTILSNTPDETIYEFGDRTCETLRRGGSSEQIADTIQAQFSRDDERMTYMYIAEVAEKTLCPKRNFPLKGWQRSLFFWKERLNGGQAL